MFYNFVLTVARPFFYLYSGKPTIIGKENLKYIEDGRAIICANHKSNWDPIILCFSIPQRHINFMAKKELFQNKLGNWFFRKMKAFPVDRDANDIGAIKHALKLLKNEHVFGIFPEGRRNKNGQVLEFKDGMALIAHKTKSTILPIGIKNEVGFRKRAVIEIGKPIDLSEFYGQKGNVDIFKEMNSIVHKEVALLAAPLPAKK